MTKEQMMKVAQDVFVRYKKVDKVYVTADGQAFTECAFAKNHAKKNRTGKELSVETFLRSEVKSTTTTAKTAEELIADINAATEVELVTKVLETEEAAKKPRKSVVEAAKAKIEELTKTE